MSQLRVETCWSVGTCLWRTSCLTAATSFCRWNQEAAGDGRSCCAPVGCSVSQLMVETLQQSRSLQWRWSRASDNKPPIHPSIVTHGEQQHSDCFHWWSMLKSNLHLHNLKFLLSQLSSAQRAADRHVREAVNRQNDSLINYLFSGHLMNNYQLCFDPTGHRYDTQTQAGFKN